MIVSSAQNLALFVHVVLTKSEAVHFGAAVQLTSNDELGVGQMIRRNWALKGWEQQGCKRL